MSKKRQPKTSQGQVVKMGMAEEKDQALPITPWQTYSFAPKWFTDALAEARSDADGYAARREIIFAVCCIESYLFEWVRDRVPAVRFDELERYFPFKEHQGIRDRWKEVIKSIHEDGYIETEPRFDAVYWSDFTHLVDLRNGLVHGSSSRPLSSSQDDDKQPNPSKGQLDQFEQGTAVRTIARVIRELHEAIGTDPPGWLVDP